MKLLVVVPAVGPAYGGSSKSVMELAQSLGKSGVDVDLITTNANVDVIIDAPVGQWIQKANYRLQYFPYHCFGDYKLSLSMTRWLLQHSQEYDLVQTNAIFSVPNLPAYLACRCYSIPYVVIPHGMLDPWALSYKTWKKRIYYTLFEHPALQQASALQMLASAEAEQIQPLNLRPPIVISPNGIHRQDFEVLPNPEGFYQEFPHTQGKSLILFLGRLDPKKGLDLLAEAFSRVKLQFPNAHLVVAGPDNIGFLPKAKQYFANHSSLESVTFTGMLSGELKSAALAAADYYIAPSYSEGFSMSVLEGMASGLPCIITTGCNFPEAAQAKVAHVVDINADAIAEAMHTCLANPQAASAIGKQAREFVFNHYTWDKIAKNLQEVYQAILSQQPLAQYT